MNKAHAHVLLRVLREPGHMAALAPDAWDLLLRQAFSAGLIGRLGALAARDGVLEALDPTVSRHLRGWLDVSGQQHRAVRWELHKLGRDLAELKGPVLLLKGAAYVAGDEPAAAGRMFADIDVMVPREQLDAAEAALMLGGWATEPLSAYDLRYYRQWTHELPPMRHLRRMTVLDLHHSIVPVTARIKTRPDLLMADARPLGPWPRFHVPSRCDLVLHSATHLFQEGEWGHGLRDLVDMDALLRTYGTDDGFWTRLLDRARLLGLGRPLFHALGCCIEVLDTPVPPQVLAACPDRPGPLHARAMRRLFVAAMGSAHHSLRSGWTGMAEQLLYVRGHWLRMPPHLLIPHLLYKSWQDHVQPLFERAPEQPRALP